VSDGTERPVLGPLALFLSGGALAAWGATCGIGGGLFAVPLLHYLVRLPLRAAVATSLVLVAATTTAASAAELLHAEGALHLPTVGALLAGSLVGTRIGFALAQRIRTRELKIVFAVVLSAVALKLAFEPSHAVGSGGAGANGANGAIGALEDLGLTPLELGWIVLTGFAAGVVAPLLGVGGGLVAVPALYLGVSPLGYLGARASSMAMSMVNAWVAILLYRRTGETSWGIARPLAAGALVGGVVGVWAVHHPELVSVARYLLAATLIVAALRFAWDLRARAAASSQA
jgi:uncharacterized membrane protein YfcA